MHHVKREHNMWAYMFYMIHLHEVEETDYTSLDIYVANLVGIDVTVVCDSIFDHLFNDYNMISLAMNLKPIFS